MDLIKEIKSNISISSVLAKMGLKPNGSGKINSIYHRDKNPSMQIYFNTNSFYDFSTNSGGDVIKLYKDFYGITTAEAIKELAKDFNIIQSNSMQPYERIEPIQRPLKEKSFSFELLDSEKPLFDERAGVYDQNGNNIIESEIMAYSFILKERKQIQTALYKALYSLCFKQGIDEQAYKYLTGKQRGLTERTLKQFKIFFINNVKTTIEFLKDNYSKDELLISGLFTKKKYFVFSKHRIVIPFIENSEIAYLRGRYFFNGLPNSTDGFGKYIGLSNFATNLTSKRFFNIDLLKTLPPHSDLVITEGEFDCMVANQNNIDAIGISGVSSFPKHQIKELDFHNVHLLFDSDEAGTKASNEIANLFEKPIKIIKLKNYKDITELNSYESIKR